MVSNVVSLTVPTQQIKNVNFKSQKTQNSSAQSFHASHPMTMDEYVARQEKEQKKQKIKNNVSLTVGVLAGIAIIASAIFAIKQGKFGGPGQFNINNLEFKNLSNDERIFNIKESKSLHPKVKKFFNELLEKGAISEKFAKRAGILGEGGTNSVLLLGNSGVGKTEVIKAYAKAANADYVAIKLSDFSNSYVNGTSQNITEMIKALIKRAKANADKTLVISLDEVDALVKVTAMDTSGEISKNRQSLLTGIDELLALKNVRLFTSSNANIKDLDGAFVRRCGYNFEVPMPDAGQLKEALKFQLRKCEGAMENGGKFFEKNNELDNFLDKLVERKCAFGDVKNIVKAAKDTYALEMSAKNNASLPFKVDYLKEALANIETTAGEMAAASGSAI